MVIEALRWMDGCGWGDFRMILETVIKTMVRYTLHLQTWR